MMSPLSRRPLSASSLALPPMDTEATPAQRTPWRKWMACTGGILLVLALLPFVIGSSNACSWMSEAYLWLLLLCLPVQMAGWFAFTPVASNLLRAGLAVLALGITLMVALAAFLGADLFRLCRLF